MKFRSNRGTVGIDLLIVVAVIALLAKPATTPGKDHWWQFWKKNPIEQVQKTQAELDKAKREEDAKIEKAKADVRAENSKQLESAHEGSVATVKAVEEAQKTTASGKLPMKELQTAKQTADLTKNALDQATGTTVAPARIKELEDMVTNLNAGIAAGAESMKSLNAALDNSVAREKILDEKVIKVENEAKTKIEKIQGKLEEKQGEANTWALERDAIARKFENFKFWSFLGIGVIVLLWLAATFLPLLAKAFPAVEPFAKVAGGIWSGGLQKAHNEAVKLNEDFVAMTEMLKSKVAEKATPEEMDRLKKEMQTDWMTVHDGAKAAVDKIKAKLRL